MSRVRKAIILAAGRSTRYGSNKLIDPILGKSTIQYCIEFCIENKFYKLLIQQKVLEDKHTCFKSFDDLDNTRVQWSSNMATEVGYNYFSLGMHNRNFDMNDDYIAMIDYNQETVYIIEYNEDNTALPYAFKSFSFEKAYGKTVRGVTDFELVAIGADYFAASTSGTDLHVWSMTDGSFVRTIVNGHSDPNAIKIYNEMLIVTHNNGTNVYNMATGAEIFAGGLNGGASVDASDFYILVGDPNAGGRGKAYLYYRTAQWGTAGSLRKTLDNPNVTTTNVTGSDLDRFGASVSCRDYEILVGAPGEDDPGDTVSYADWGSVYSFR